jgi:hypothetical protein
MACGGVRGVLGRAIAARTGRERAKEVNLGEELNVVAGADGRGFHEILAGVAGETRAHEDVQDIVDMGFGLLRSDASFGCQGAAEVRMAAMVVLAAVRQEVVSVGVAAGADHVMDGAAEAVEAVPVERVVSDCGHRTQMGERRPHAVTGGQVRAMQGAGLAGVETLGQVGGVPEVEVADLWAFDGMDAEEVTGGTWNVRASRGGTRTRPVAVSVARAAR